VELKDVPPISVIGLKFVIGIVQGEMSLESAI
jgi:hypothetical protein